MGNEHSKNKGGHVLGSAPGGAASPSQGRAGSSGNVNVPDRRSSLPPNEKPKPLAQAFKPSPPAKPATSETDREARLAAIEARMGAAEKRGVQKGGGKLAKQLEERKHNPGAPSLADNRNDVAELWKN
ncbi:hypothetical protein HDU96_003503 [Phlyctochytrium bullatum]|nr:hypothetical protein HDU96_003503 [Phlyctochytrium bullatum]